MTPDRSSRTNPTFTAASPRLVLGPLLLLVQRASEPRTTPTDSVPGPQTGPRTTPAVSVPGPQTGPRTTPTVSVPGPQTGPRTTPTVSVPGPQTGPRTIPTVSATGPRVDLGPLLLLVLLGLALSLITLTGPR